MSNTIDIFVDTDVSFHGFLENLEILLETPVQRYSRNDEIWYEFHYAHAVLAVGGHDYENDNGIRFEDYRYDIEIRAITVDVKTVEEQQDRLDHAAQTVFQKLQETRKYRILMVANLQEVLDSFTP